MTRSTVDGAGVVRSAKPSGAADGDVAAYRPLLVDAGGALVVTGAGAAPASDRFKIQDAGGVNLAVITAAGEVKIIGTVTLDGAADFAREATLLDVKRSISDFATRLDYDVRTDGNPVYVGKAPQGTLTSAVAWTVQRLTYDASARLILVEVRSGVVWDNRAVGW